MQAKHSTLSLATFIQHVRQNREARFLLIQLSVNFSFMFVELVYGFLSNSLGLISDSVHMLIDSSALAIGVYASFVARLAPNSTFPFGYERVEVLSGFVNGIFLLFVVVEIISESFERLLNPQPVAPEKMILVSTLGLGINILGLCFFHEHSHFHSEEDDTQECEVSVQNRDKHKHEHNHDHSDHKHEHHDHGHNHDHGHSHHDHEHDHDHDHVHDHASHDHHNEHVSLTLNNDTSCSKHSHNHHGHNHNLAGVYLHILADALGSVACILSAGIIYFYEFYLADPITSLVISLLILFTTVNLLRDTSKILLFQLPTYGIKFHETLNKQIQDVQNVKDAEVKIFHFAGKAFVLLGKLTIERKNEQSIQKQVNMILNAQPKLKFTFIDYHYLD